MSNYYSVIDTNTNTNKATNTNTNTNTNTVASKKAKPEIYEDFLIFGNFFGLVPDAYVKYFNLFGLQPLTIDEARNSFHCSRAWAQSG